MHEQLGAVHQQTKGIPRALHASSSSVIDRTFFYVVDWLPPDFGAVGQYGVIFARDIANSGRDVCLIGLTSGASNTCYERPAGGSGMLEIKRLSTGRYNKSGLISRSLWSLRTNFRLIFEVVRDPRSRGAEVLFTGAPPFMLFFAVFAKWLRGARLIYRITDFYPEVLIAALGKRSLLLAVFEKITWAMRRQVDTIQVLGEDQRRLILGGGILPEQIVLKRDVPPISISGAEIPTQRPNVLKGLKILLYSGNFGAAHDVDTLVEGLIQHHRGGQGKFGLWLNASGSNVSAVIGRLQTAKVPVAHTEPVELEQLPALLAAADAHLVTLRAHFSGLVLPSKIYGCLHSGRPIVFVGPTDSDIHYLCSQANRLVYHQVEPGDYGGFASALDRLTSLKNAS
jgi:hypothetical protein